MALWWRSEYCERSGDQRPTPRGVMEVRSNSARSPLRARWAPTDLRAVRAEKSGSRKTITDGPAPLRATPRIPGLPVNSCRHGSRGQSRGAVRLMDAVFERSGEQVVTTLRKGGQQQHRVLDVRDGVLPGILRRQHAASFFGGQGLVWHGKKQRPLPFWTDADYLDLGVTRPAGNSEATHPARGDVVGMVLAAGSLSDNLSIGQAQTPKVIRQGDASETGGGRRTATLADGNIVLNAKRQRNNLHVVRLEDLSIGVENQVIL